MAIRFPAIDITDRGDGKVLVWDSGDSIHKYISPVNAAAVSVTSVRRTTSQNVSGSGSYTAISWDTEDVDDDGAWAIGAPTTIVVPSALNGRKAIVHAQGVWTGSTSGNYRHLAIRHSVDSLIAESMMPRLAITGAHRMQVTSRVITLVTGHTIQLDMRADATGIGMDPANGLVFMELRTVD